MSTEPQAFTFDLAQETVFRFEELLCSHGIKVKPGSQLENAACGVFEVLYRHRGESHIVSGDADLLRSLIGLQDLASKLLAVARSASFRRLLPHLRLLNQCPVTQNTWSPKEYQDANKVIELYIAALCLRQTDVVEIDDPECSVGRNPDVIAMLSGKRWGFACKTLHSRSPQTLFDHIDKAAQQIQRAGVDIGVPVVNIKNVLNHNAIWPPDGIFLHEGVPARLVREQVLGMGRELLAQCGEPALRDLWAANDRCVPGFACIGHAATGVMRGGQCVATRLNVLTFVPIFHSPMIAEAEQVFGSLNHHMQGP